MQMFKMNNTHSNPKSHYYSNATCPFFRKQIRVILFFVNEQFFFVIATNQINFFIYRKRIIC